MWNRIFRQKCSSVDSYRCRTSLLTVTQHNTPDILRKVFACSQLSGNGSEETANLQHTGFLKKSDYFQLVKTFTVLTNSKVHLICPQNFASACNTKLPPSNPLWLRFVLKLPDCHKKKSSASTATGYGIYSWGSLSGMVTSCTRTVSSLFLLVCEVRVRRYYHYDYPTYANKTKNFSALRARFFRNTKFLIKNP